MNEPIQKIIIIGGGSAGWMSAAYLSKSLQGLDITVIESPDAAPIGVGEATIPTIKTEFFDRLGIEESEWMPALGATYKLGIKYQDWRKSPQQGGDHYYHIFGEVPMIDEVPLSAVWIKRYLEGKTQTPFTHSCLAASVAFDHHLSPRTLDGTQYIHYAYHFDALGLANFLKNWTKQRGVKHVIDKLINAKQDEQGNITEVVSEHHAYAADLFIDCSGFAGVLIDKVFKEPIVSFKDFLITDRAIAVNIPDAPDQQDIRNYTSAIAMKSGWMWEIPLFDRSGNGYVYSSEFISDDDAMAELQQHFGERLKNTSLRPIKFNSRRHERAWVKNCVAIGLSSSFLEPLESSTIYFIYAALYQLVKCFPNKQIDPALRDKYNRKVNYMVDDNMDFIAMHFKTVQREDTPFWKANKYETKMPDSLKEILTKHKAGLPIKRPTVTNDNLYPTFKSLFQNFWTETNYQCILCGVGYLPNQPYPLLNYRDDILQEADKLFEKVKRESAHLKEILPTHFEYLQSLRENVKDLVNTE